MDGRRLVVVVSFAACALAARSAWSDVFTWVDGAGNVTVSNVPPPDGARVTKVVKPTAAEKAANERARDASRDAEVQALSARVRQLEQQVQASVNGPPPDVAYPPIVSPPVRFGMAAPPPLVSYAADEPPQTAAFGPYGCDPAWIGCWPYVGVPAGVVVIEGANGRHRSHGSHGGQHNGAHRSGGHHSGCGPPMPFATRMPRRAARS